MDHVLHLRTRQGLLLYQRQRPLHPNSPLVLGTPPTHRNQRPRIDQYTQDSITFTDQVKRTLTRSSCAIHSLLDESKCASLISAPVCTASQYESVPPRQPFPRTHRPSRTPSHHNYHRYDLQVRGLAGQLAAVELKYAKEVYALSFGNMLNQRCLEADWSV